MRHFELWGRARGAMCAGGAPSHPSQGGPGHPSWGGDSHLPSQATRHFDEVQDPPWTGGGRVWRPAIGCVRFRTAVMDILFAMVTQLTLRDDNPFSLAVDVRRREHLTQVWLTSGFALGGWQ